MDAEKRSDGISQKRKIDEEEENSARSNKSPRFTLGSTEIVPPVQETGGKGCSGNTSNNLGQRGRVFDTSHLRNKKQ